MRLKLLALLFFFTTLVPTVCGFVYADVILSPPQIADGRAVWTVNAVTDVVEPGKIYLYHIATGVIKRLDDDVADSVNDSSPRIDGDRVVWVRTDETGRELLMIYDLAMEESPQEAPPDFVWEDSIQADGDLTVLTRHDGGDREIIIQSESLKVEQPLTENTADDSYPGISGNSITWTRGEGADSEILVLAESGAGGETQVTDNDYEDGFSHIKENYLVWQGRADMDWEIFFQNVETGQDPVRLTQNDYDDISPQTDGDYLVWLGYSHSGGGIFVHDISSGKTTQVSTEAGDQDCDWDLDLTDAILGLQVNAGLSPLNETCSSADANGDSTVGLAEILYILQHLAGIRE